LNVSVRAHLGHDGTIVIVSAWCGGCGEDAMPDRHGACMFCDLPILDEDSLSSRSMIMQMGGATVDTSERVRTPAVPTAKRQIVHRKKQWPRERMLEAIHRFHHDTGRVPLHEDCLKANGMPNHSTLKREFGSFAAAIEAAGFVRPSQGRPSLLDDLAVR
jgi:hypothetical protein